MTALSIARPGAKYTIRWNVSRGDCADLMRQLGLTPGTTLFLLNSYSGGVIVCVGGKRIALDKESAFCIKV